MKLQLILPLVLSTLRSIYCQETPVQGECSDDEHGDLRLVNKQGDNYGALQVCDSEYGWRYFIWGDWTERAARLACMDLGLLYLNPTTSTLELTNYVYIRKVSSFFCIEKAQELKECVINTNRIFNFVITVNCSNDNVPREECTHESELRLVNGTSYREGRVEVCVDGRWGTVCGKGWTNEDAGHVCSRLGYSSTNAMFSYYGEGTGPVYDVHYNVSNCLTINTTQCDHSQDLGVQCESYTEACEAEIRETLSSLTTALPPECPTLLTTKEVKTPVQLHNVTTTPTGASEESLLNNSSTSDTLGALLGLLVVTLVAVLAGWIMTCVYLHRKINKQNRDHIHPGSPNDPALQLHNPVYDTSVPPPHTTYSSLGPSYQNNQGAGHSYDVINRPYPLREADVEYSVVEGPTHTPGGGVVEGTYSLVGENDPQDYEVPTSTTEGGQEYSTLQH